MQELSVLCPTALAPLEVNIQQSVIDAYTLENDDDGSNKRFFELSACTNDDELLESMLLDELPNTAIALVQNPSIYFPGYVTQTLNVSVIPETINISVRLYMVTNDTIECIAEGSHSIRMIFGYCTCGAKLSEETETFGYMTGQSYWKCEACNYFRWKSRDKLKQRKQEITTVNEFARLPLDCFYEIMTYVPVRDIVREIRHLNKFWHDLLTYQSDLFWRDLSARYIDRESRIRWLGKNVSSMHVCYLFDCKAENKCFSCLSHTYGPLQRGFSVCRRCKVSECISKQELVQRYGFLTRQLQHCSTMISVNGNPYRWRTEAYKVIGDGNLQRGKQIMASRDQSVDQQQFLKRAKRRRVWVKRLTGSMQQEGFSEQEIDEILYHHDTDYKNLCSQREQQLSVLLDEEFTKLSRIEVYQLIAESFADLDAEDCHITYLAMAFKNEKILLQEFSKDHQPNKSELEVMENSLKLKKYDLGLAALRSEMNQALKLIAENRSLLQAIDDELQIQSEGRFTLHDTIPPVVQSILDETKRQKDPEMLAKQIIDIWTREESFSTLLEQYYAIDYNQVYLPRRVLDWLKTGRVETGYGQIGVTGRPAIKDVYSALNEFLQITESLKSSGHAESLRSRHAERYLRSSRHAKRYLKLMHREYSRDMLAKISAQTVRNGAPMRFLDSKGVIRAQQQPVTQTILRTYQGKRKRSSDLEQCDTTQMSKKKKR